MNNDDLLLENYFSTDYCKGLNYSVDLDRDYIPFMFSWSGMA